MLSFRRDRSSSEKRAFRQEQPFRPSLGVLLAAKFGVLRHRLRGTATARARPRALPPTPRHARRPVGLQQARALLLGVRCADHDRQRGSQHHVHHARLHTPRCPSGAGARRSNRGIACVRSKQHRYDAERKLACLAARHCCSDRSRWAGSECVSLYLARRPDVCECLGCPCLQCAWATTAGKI